ncbi:MAG: methyltransferase domain-containing protein [Gammaproteobacteria bacterium]|nr:methyltransferase domain-containing protein [Gammaproteobacteria bacterium]
MSLESYYKDHWVDIDAQRLDRYEQMFQWRDAQERLLAPADVQPGHVAVDYGCGPGFVTLELLRRVGPRGHVHAFDVNAEFLRRTASRAANEGFDAQLTTHLLTDAEIPLPAGAVHRVIAKNVMVYVDDPLATFRDFRRITQVDGLVHAIDSDFWMSVVDPVKPLAWRALMDAAGPAFRTPTIGRQLYRLAAESGFRDVKAEVVSRPDTEGRMLHFITNMAGYARLGGASEALIEEVLTTAREAVNSGTFFALNPQFMVTARV